MATAEWDPLGPGTGISNNNDTFYRRTLLYSLTWSFPGSDLSDWICIAAKNGGPIALTRDESKPVLLTTTATGGHNDSKSKRIWIYTCAGTLLHVIVWDHSSKIAKIGWTSNESLVVLARDGIYRLYPISSSGTSGSVITSNYVSSSSNTSPSSSPTYTQHSLTHDVQDTHIVDAVIYDDGMVILLSSHQFIQVKGWPESSSGAGGGEYGVSSSSDAANAGAGSGTSSSGSTSTFIASSSSKKTNDHTQHQNDNNNRYGKGRVARMVETDFDHSPSTWCILTPDQSTSRQSEVIVSYNDAVFAIDELEIQDQHFSRGPFSHIVPSPSGRFKCFVTKSTSASTSSSNTASSKVYVVSSNYSETLSEYDLASESSSFSTTPPKTVLWCGNNSVVLAWDTSLLMIGPFGQTLRYDYLDPIHVVGEIDGVRIISIDKCEFLHKVPPSSVAVFSPGSVHPAAILYEAYSEFISSNSHAHESIQGIKLDLVEAVDTCIDAASKEYDINWQRKLLKTASFGKTFLDLYNPADFVAVSHTLRVLNALRNYEIGIPITYEQYQSRSPATIVSRLTLRNKHLLALRIASYLKLSVSPVLRHWAQMKVRQSKNDQEEAIQTCNLIVKRLKEEMEKGSIGASEVSCADVAKTAWEQGKLVLATKLLDHEPRASKQVQLLLSMREDNLALVKATRSGDSDLILSVLLSLRRQHSVGNFFRFLDGKDEAIAILLNYGKSYDKELIRDFWYQDDRRTESACFDLEEAAQIGLDYHDGRSGPGSGSASGSGKDANNAGGAIQTLSPEQFSLKMEKIRKAQKTFSEDKERTFETKICDDELRLLAVQQSLQAEGGNAFNVPLVGLSLNNTVRQCLTHDMAKKAEKVRTDFKIPDKRWWYLKLKALTEIRDWEQLESFAKSKKSPIGYEPFVEHLLSTGNQRQAVKFVSRCEARNRPDLYAKAGEWIKAGEECRDRGDRGKLNDLIQRCPNTLISTQLTAILEDTRSF